MNHSEKLVFEYLTAWGFSNIVYEPDGNVPPDFAIDGRIAVEVRRLNENEKTATGHRGLEEVSKPLTALIKKALVATGPPRYGISWFVSYSYRRPLPPWRQLDKFFARYYEKSVSNQTSGRVEFVLQTNCDSASLVQPNSIRIAGPR